MQKEKETRDRLLESARTEFMEKGYMKASLRNICKNAGLTTGALYFFFRDKEDLFAALVKEPLDTLWELMNDHYRAEREQMEDSQKADEIEEDQNVSVEIVHYLYQHYEDFQLAVTKSQGSGFEHCTDRFVGITEDHYRILADRQCKILNVPQLEDSLLHWMAHMHIDTFVYVITHIESEEAAVRVIGPMVKYLVVGWESLFRKE